MNGADKNLHIIVWLNGTAACKLARCALALMLVASPARATSLADINAALADMGALSGQFVQSTPGGKTLQGNFFSPCPTASDLPTHKAGTVS